MKVKVAQTLCLAASIFVAGCTTDNDVPALGTFIDHGFIPAQVDASQNISEFQTAIYNNDHIFVATTDGLWKNNLSTKVWSRAGLEGKGITAIFKHPTIADKFLAGVRSDSPSQKTVYISNDGGESWQPANAPISNPDQYEDYACFAVRPENPNHIFASLGGGATTVVSTDGGDNWVRQNNDSESYWGYATNIVFIPNDPEKLYQGGEGPLDFAWLRSYKINSTNPVMLSESSTIMDIETWGNRRPNELQTFSYTGNSIYVGQEGALSKVTGSTNKFIFKAEEEGNLPYTYVYGLWVDPFNPNHLIFGGSQNGGEDMNLYETFNEGKSIRRFEDKMGFSVPNVREIVSTNTFPGIIINDDGADKVKLYLYQPPS